MSKIDTLATNEESEDDHHSASAYRGKEASRQTYEPNANAYLVRPYDSTISPDYLRIARYGYLDTPREHDRHLLIASDTVIEMDDQSAELLGDARFVFNALITSRHIEQTTRDILNYGDGFRGRSYTEVAATSIAFSRAVQALDAWSMDVSGDLLVDRTGWGTGSHPSFSVARDIVIRDQRTAR